MRDLYTILPLNAAIEDVKRWIEEVTRLRGSDVDDYDRQQAEKPRIYSAPSSSTDLIGTEKVGDIAADASYFYIVVNDSGNLRWRRVGISSF